jgi:hypothetical protein
MAYTIYLDGAPEGPWMGHLLDEVGCIWLAPTKVEAVGRAQQEIVDFFSWLRSHGEAAAAGCGVDRSLQAIEVADAQTIPRFDQSGAAVGLFAPDLLAADEADILTAVRRLGYARRDLLEAVAGLAGETLDRQPPGGKRTLRKNLEHIRNCQGWYLTRVLGWKAVEELLPEPWPEETFPSLEWVMRRATGALLELPVERRSGTYQADNPVEDWTARKMLRRFVEHEREHVAVVRRTLTLVRGQEVGVIRS